MRAPTYLGTLARDHRHLVPDAGVSGERVNERARADKGNETKRKEERGRDSERHRRQERERKRGGERRRRREEKRRMRWAARRRRQTDLYFSLSSGVVPRTLLAREWAGGVAATRDGESEGRVSSGYLLGCWNPECS